VGRWNRLLIAVFTVIGLSISTWSVCVDGAIDSTMAPMVCCQHGHHTCGPNGAPAECCRIGSNGQQVTIAKAAPDGKSPRLLIALAVGVESILSRQIARPVVVQISPPRSSSPPPYIAFSSLLI
jgi:hypothetical protein